jgi:uncharacterized protein
VRYWPFWLGGAFLAAVPVVHWLLLRRMFAVSGRYTAITDWLRGVRKVEPQLSEDELVRLLAAETAAEFGEDAVDAAAEDAPAPAVAPMPTQAGLAPHFVFVAAVIAGGALSAWHTTAAAPHPRWPAGLFAQLLGGSLPLELIVLFAGGLLVGFGTRMAGGCTSGHGLCGTSRLQPGSLVATACFFGMGVVVSFALRACLGGH